MAHSQWFENECKRLGLYNEPRKFTLEMFKETQQLIKQSSCHMKIKIMKAALKDYAFGGNPHAPWCLS